MSATLGLTIVVILLMLSAFFSSAETSLTTVNKIRMKSLADQGNKRAKKVCSLIDEPSKMLSAILIGNNIVNLSCSSLVTSLTITYFQNIGVGITTGILTVLVLIFGEIVPKSLATKKSEKMALMFAGIILFLSKILTPVIIVINAISAFLMKLIRIDINSKEASITETELRAIVDVSHEEGVIESEERKMITNVVDFGDTVVKDVMIPQIDIDYAEITFTYDELLNKFSENKYSRLPVYSEAKDNVLGIINLKDVFFYNGNKEDFNLKDFIRDPFFTYEFKKTSELFVEMKMESIPMAIVLDEYGSIAGILTLEDMLEEIVGEIRDEYDGDEEDLIQKLTDDTYLVDGYAKLTDIHEAIGINIESDDYDSIAGHLINLFEHIPSINDIAEDKYATYQVEDLDKNRISKIVIKLKNIAVSEENED